MGVSIIYGILLKKSGFLDDNSISPAFLCNFNIEIRDMC